MRKRRAPETQNLLAALKVKMAVRGSRSEDIVLGFTKQHPEVIARETTDLVYVALMRLVGHVGSASAKGSTAAQIEMFTEYALPPTVLFRMPDGWKLHRHLQALTVDEGREHIEDRTRPRSRIPAAVKELARLLDDVEPHKKSSKSTIGECWKDFRESRSG